MDTILWLQAHFEQILLVLTSIVTAASTIAALTPTPADDAFIGKAYKVIDILALNFGKAKDKPADAAVVDKAKEEE
jgi:hypothetical protein